MIAWAKIGEKCICVDDSWAPQLSYSGDIPARAPRLKETLTITDIMVVAEVVFLKFDEIPDAGSDGGWYFNVSHFRPLTRQERDVALFANALLTAPANVELEAV